MILDTSAVAAIFFGEPEAALFTQLIHAADRCLMSAANFLELSIVIEGQIGPDAGRQAASKRRLLRCVRPAYRFCDK